ncbi:hypothetical protein C0J52_05775 [Blattella germanica]|nr:hypothetical protein C0J52_05775 [Blattella germanica]PSN45541.1 hypothetical protein C0J52_05775 [Blattella germanica]
MQFKLNIIIHPLFNRHSHLRTEYYFLIYRLCIRPILTYASPVWNRPNASNTPIRKLKTFQNNILRRTVNAPWYIRNSALHT